MAESRTFKVVQECERLSERKGGRRRAGYLGNLAQAKSLWQLNASLWSSPRAVWGLVGGRREETQTRVRGYSDPTFTISISGHKARSHRRKTTLKMPKYVLLQNHNLCCRGKRCLDSVCYFAQCGCCWKSKYFLSQSTLHKTCELNS